MKKLINFTLIALLIISFSIQGYAADNSQHTYYKYAVKTIWNKTNNNDKYDKKPIYSNQVVRTPLSGYNSVVREYGVPIVNLYIDYEIAPLSVYGYNSYEIKGNNPIQIKIGSTIGTNVVEIIPDVSGNSINGYIKSTYIANHGFIEEGVHKTKSDFQLIEKATLKLEYYIYEHKDKDSFLSTIKAPLGSYPANGVHADGYWYVNMTLLNKNPEISILEPIQNYRIGNQDNIKINGEIKDEDVGDPISIKYSVGNIESSNITLTQPISIISNGQNQFFQGNINLTGLSSGENILELWAEDDKGGKSTIVEVPIFIFNTLENILKSLESCIYKAGEPQVLIINSNAIITQNIANDSIINQIKRELEVKNVKLYFIGKNGATENYIKSKLLSN